MRTREAPSALIEGRLASPAGRSELVELATRLIVEEALEGEVRDALDRGYYGAGRLRAKAIATATGPIAWLEGSSCVVSIIFIEGFDYYASVANVAASNWTVNSTSLASLSTGRFGGQCFRHSGSSQRLISRSIPGTNTLTLGVAIKFEDPANVSGNHPFIAFMTAAAAARSAQLTLRFSARRTAVSLTPSWRASSRLLVLAIHRSGVQSRTN